MPPGPLPPLSLQNQVQKIPKEKENGITQLGSRKGWCRLRCVCGSDEDLDEAWVMKTFKAGSLEKLVEHLVLAFLKGNFSYIRIFLGTYRTYATTQQVLDQLLQRYGCNHPYSAQDAEPQDQLKGAISFILGTWLKEYSEDFDQPPDFPCLKLVMEYVQVNMPGSHLEHRAQLLLAQLDQMEVTETEPEAPEPRPGPVVKVAQDPSLPRELAPAPCSGHPMDNWMERWIPTLDYFQNRNLDQQLMSILLLLQHRSSVEHQLFHDELQLWQQRASPMEVRILNLGHLQSQRMDNLVMWILVLNGHRSSIEHHQLQHCHHTESWIFTLGDFQNTFKENFMSYILSLQQHWSWVHQQVLQQQVEQTESLLEDRILFLGQHHNGLLDHLVRLIMLLD
ncbi:ral guanine nucleotide dissociation stimulator-like [Elephas maximus indicus]|uniref:ral guanine nucleotide dissociation stimulator-like n=1 Tax=Elephas maximus indicus TaxID=99487 RepID=UPI0021166B32|nr:ral guanine nucleotide dissociation stimulator-like [Elephas maximus indicus]